MIFAVVFALTVAAMVWRSRIKRKRRPATASDVLDAASVQGIYPQYLMLPPSVDPDGGRRDVGF